MRGKAARTIELIGTCTNLLEEIQPCSVRAVCYRLFVAGQIDSMHVKNTRMISRLLTTAREEGSIPWEWIVDETREVEQTSTWADPKRFAKTITKAYRKDKWAAQPKRVEVWSEKGTIRGTLAPVLDQYEVAFRVMHGFASATAVNAAAETIQEDERELVILYVGDWDPSGLHMSEVDLPERLSRYTDGGDFEVVRIALAKSDLRSLPSFEAVTKAKDPRYQWFVKTYGRRCWELDAMSPVSLRARVETSILNLLDKPTWDRYVAAEVLEQASIASAVSAWGKLKVAV